MSLTIIKCTENKLSSLFIIVYSANIMKKVKRTRNNKYFCSLDFDKRVKNIPAIET